MDGARCRFCMRGRWGGVWVFKLEGGAGQIL